MAIAEASEQGSAQRWGPGPVTSVELPGWQARSGHWGRPPGVGSCSPIPRMLTPGLRERA